MITCKCGLPSTLADGNKFETGRIYKIDGRVAGLSGYPIYSGFAPSCCKWIAKLRNIDPVASISEETASKFQRHRIPPRR
jgi:hypothetical protein